MCRVVARTRAVMVPLAHDLPDSDELARLACECPYPVCMLAIGHDLVIHGVAGQLAPLVPYTVGEHLLDIDDPHRPRVRAAIRALNGEVVAFEVIRFEQRWQITFTPYRSGEGEVLGIVSVGRILGAMATPTENPLITFAAVRPATGVEVGDLVTVGDSGDGEEAGSVWRHRRLSRAAFEALLAVNCLMPVASAPAWLRSTAGPVPVPAPGGPPLRLVPGGVR